jgi:outer membrane protein TolC
LALLPISGAGQQSDNTYSIALENAVGRAVSVSPQVRIAEGRILSARGFRAQSVWPFPDNPSVVFERARRRSLVSEAYDYSWRVSQQMEIAGQSFLRKGAADRRVNAAEALVMDAARTSALDARLAYLTLHLAERRAALSAESAELAEELASVARRQLDAGEINVIEYNTAALEAARARSQADRFEGERRASSAELSRALGIVGDSVVQTVALPALPDLPALERVGALALERRPDMQAATLEVDAADRILSANRRRMVPNLQLDLFTGQEAGTDELLGFSVGFSVPLFHRGQADVGAARADRAAAAAISDGTARLIRAEVEAESRRYAGAHEAERRFSNGLLLAGAENAELAAVAFEEGELSVADVVVFQATALATRLEHLEVLADAYAAWFALAAALDAPPEELIQLLETNDAIPE